MLTPIHQKTAGNGNTGENEIETGEMGFEYVNKV